MEMVGHISPRMTRYYTHIGSDLKKFAAAKIQQHNTHLAKILGLQLADGTSRKTTVSLVKQLLLFLKSLIY